MIVHPSPYGADNACTLDALRKLGPRARGVAVIDDTISARASPTCMRPAFVACGSISNPTARAIRRWPGAPCRGGARVAPLGWHVQTYTNLAVLRRCTTLYWRCRSRW